MIKYLYILRKVFYQILVASYLVFSLLSLSHCSRADNRQSTSEKLSEKKKLLLKSLENDFAAVPFIELSKNSRQGNMIFDTTVIAVSKRGEEVYLKTKINCKTKEDYFGFFKCNEEIYNQFLHTKTNNLLLVARISEIQKRPVRALSDSLDGNFTEVEMDDATLLTGECLAIRAVPTFSNDI